jgi:hypothetical protein
MSRLSVVVAPLIVLPLIGASWQKGPARPRLAPVRRACGASITAVRESTDADGQRAASYGVTNDGDLDLLRVQTIVMVYGHDGLRRTTDTVDALPAELPLAHGAVLSQTHALPDLRDDDYVRVAVGELGAMNEQCQAAQAERAADAEFDPPALLVANPEGSPVTLGTAKLLASATGDPVAAEVAVVNHAQGGAVAKLTTLVFEYSPVHGATIRVQTINPVPILASGTNLETIGFTVPKIREGYSWKVVLMPLKVTADGRTWSLEHSITQGKDALAAAAVGR